MRSSSCTGRNLLAVLLVLAANVHPLNADELPPAIACYQSATNTGDIDSYLACFAADAKMIDVSREFVGHDAIRAWAIREVIPNGETFSHREFLEVGEGYAKTEVNWMRWVVHYSYWWDAENKITQMSLQYAN